MKKGKIFFLLAKFDEKQTSKGKCVAKRDSLLSYTCESGKSTALIQGTAPSRRKTSVKSSGNSEKVPGKFARSKTYSYL